MVGAIFMIASLAVSAYSAYSSVQAQNDIAEYNSKIAMQKAEAQRMALEAEKRAEVDKSRAQQAQLRARATGRQLDITSGSPLLMLTENAAQNQYNQFELHRQATIAKQTGISQASLLQYEASQANKATYIQFGAQALSTAAQGYESYQTSEMQSELETDLD